MISLTPVATPRPKDFNYSTFDVEARKWINFLCGAAAWRNPDSSSLEVESFLSMEDYLDFVFSKDHPYDLVFAHAGGIYDFDFILHEAIEKSDNYFIDGGIQRGNGFLSLKLSKVNYLEESEFNLKNINRDKIISCIKGIVGYKTRTIEFRDSTGVLPFSLDSLSKNFNVEHKKKKFDYNKIKKVTPELIEYNKRDCVALLEVLEKYSQWPLIKEVGVAQTMASQSVKVFRKFLYKEIPSLSASQDSFARRSYFGGRTEIFKPIYDTGDNKKDILYYYDVNSLYPYVMLDEMPIAPLNTHVKDIDSEMGYVDCVVKVPDCYIPILATSIKVNDTNKLVFPVGTFRGVFSTVELRYAMSHGVKIKKIYRSMKYENGGKFFKPYIETMYELRQQSEKGTVTNILAKLLMNSLYGRFGLNRDRDEIKFYSLGSDCDSYHSTISTPTRELNLYLKKTRLEKSHSNVAVSAWVTSLARIHMHKLITPNQDHIYMMDTDSMLVSRKNKSNDDKLGALKLEFTANRGVFLLPKTYFLDNNKKGDGSTVVMKGFDKKLVQGFTYEDFIDQFEGEIRLKTGPKQVKAKLRTALKKGSFLSYQEEQGREIRSVYDKRVFTRTSKGNWDTEPLVVDGEHVLNLDKERQSKLFYKMKAQEKESGIYTKYELSKPWSI
jgi:hypothetical protein